MTKTTTPKPPRTRREPSELDGKIAAIRKAARVLDRLRTRAAAAALAVTAAEQVYNDATAAIAKPGAVGDE